MHVTIVHIWVNDEYREAFLEATRKNHEASTKESGNLRFDVLQDVDDPNKFVLYEAYKSAADAVAHKTTEHYLRWREAVAPMMAKPRKGVLHHGLYL